MTMRYLMKGGIWKNAEDEVLKAAVMKYGLNQWPRISSLIPRKTAKQCKARWTEWLDPAIKKTEWSREEEEKLLHLTRVFPAQWRTIAPLVGRTAAQCVEKFAELLDAATGGEKARDAGRLGPGEVDPTPEIRPAKADPIDMDDEEKEMIAELRVRLANYKGKKAKRKARERTIEETRRLAQVQKFRELRNAGVDFIVERKQRKKKKEFDYGDEVPLERKPEFPLGVPAEQTPAPSKDLGNIDVALLEGQRRHQAENRKRIDDLRKLKRLNEVDAGGRLQRLEAKSPFAFFAKEPLDLPPPALPSARTDRLARRQTSLSAPRLPDLISVQLDPLPVPTRTPLPPKPPMPDVPFGDTASLASFSVGPSRSAGPILLQSGPKPSKKDPKTLFKSAEAVEEMFAQLPPPDCEVQVDLQAIERELERASLVLGESLLANGVLDPAKVGEVVKANLRSEAAASPFEAKVRAFILQEAGLESQSVREDFSYLLEARRMVQSSLDDREVEVVRNSILELHGLPPSENFDEAAELERLRKLFSDSEEAAEREMADDVFGKFVRGIPDQ